MVVSLIRHWVKARPLREARKARADALERVREAEARNDTRALGSARMVLQEAQHRCLQLEGSSTYKTNSATLLRGRA